MAPEKYAIYFPELSKDCLTHEGYLWIRTLGEGVEGTVVLVRSVTDGQLFARKKTLPLPPAGRDYHFRENHFYCKHPRVPELISHTECKIMKDIRVSKRKEAKSLVMVSKYCNGGTLEDFSNTFADGERPRSELSESILWHLFTAQLETISFFHNGSPPLGRLDSHMQNIFLHFPDKSSKFPEFYVGDLGQLELVERQRSYESMLHDDLENLQKNLAYLSKFVRRSLSEDDYVDIDEVGYDDEDEDEDAEENEEGKKGRKRWSKAFHEALDLLHEVWRAALKLKSPGKFSEAEYSRHPAFVKLEQLRKIAAAAAEEYRAKDTDEVDFSWARQKVGNPELYSTKEALLQDCKGDQLGGPFQLARVDAETFSVLDIEETQYGITFPRETDVGDPDARYNFLESDLITDPLEESAPASNFDEYDSDSCPSSNEDVPAEQSASDSDLDESEPEGHDNFGQSGGKPVEGWLAAQARWRESNRDNGDVIIKRGHAKNLWAEFRATGYVPGVRIVYVPFTDAELRAQTEPEKTTPTSETPSTNSGAPKPKPAQKKDKVTKPQRTQLWHRCNRHKRLHLIADCLNDLLGGTT